MCVCSSVFINVFVQCPFDVVCALYFFLLFLFLLYGNCNRIRKLNMTYTQECKWKAILCDKYGWYTVEKIEFADLQNDDGGKNKIHAANDREKERHREALKMIIWNLYKVLTFEPMYNWQKHIFGNSGSIQSNNVVPSSNAFMSHTLVSWIQIEPPNEHTVKIDWIELDWNEMEWQRGQHILNKQSWKVALMKRNIYFHTHALSHPSFSLTKMIGEIMSPAKVIMGLIFKGILASMSSISREYFLDLIQNRCLSIGMALHVLNHHQTM